MDQRESQLQSMSICHRLFLFIMKSLASHAHKTVHLGSTSNQGSTQVPITTSHADNGAGSNSDHPMAQEKPCEDAIPGAKVELDEGNGSKNLDPFGPHDKELPPVQGNIDDIISSSHEVQDNKDSYMNSGKMTEEAAPLSTAAPGPKPPKKMVSINVEVEVISTPKKKKKLNKTLSKSTSSEREEDAPKPLKSILKVGSKNEKSVES
ncbi:hypothetical protein ACB098_03G044200 [Castanea mollissima]